MKIESAVLRRLGPVPFWRGTTRCLDELDRIYRRAIGSVKDPSKSTPSRDSGGA